MRLWKVSGLNSPLELSETRLYSHLGRFETLLAVDGAVFLRVALWVEGGGGGWTGEGWSEGDRVKEGAG